MREGVRCCYFWVLSSSWYHDTVPSLIRFCTAWSFLALAMTASAGCPVKRVMQSALRWARSVSRRSAV